jgi:alpha-N-arabinofuranosidase
MLTIARSKSPFGPFEPYARNPILTHRQRRELPIQATGHGDLLQTASGSWWLVLLGIRPWDGAHHHLGRETFLAPVRWDRSGWPVVNEGRPLGLTMNGAGLPPAQPWETPSPRDEFSADRLGLAWNFLRNPSAADWSLSARPGFLRLLGNAHSLNEVGAPAFVGQRQRHLRCQVSALLEFEPQTAEQEAGLTLRSNEQNHYDLVITRGPDGRRVRLRTRIKGVERTVAEQPLSAGAAVLGVRARADQYEFFVSSPDGTPRSLGSAPTIPLSSEVAGGFTGVYFGLFAATGGGAAMPPADFDWFDYSAEP